MEYDARFSMQCGVHNVNRKDIRSEKQSQIAELIAIKRTCGAPQKPIYL